MQTISDAKARACAYHLVDIIQTRAFALMDRDKRLTYARACDIAMDKIAKQSKG
jgi:hypothetical protein